MFELPLIQRRIQQDFIINVHRPSHKNNLYSSQILMKLALYRYIFEKCPNINFMKIRPVAAELFHAGMTKLTVVFRNCAIRFKMIKNREDSFSTITMCQHLTTGVAIVRF
jgi:hypothetical protein